MAANLKKVSATSKVADGPLYLKSIILASGSDAATLIIDNSADGSGTDLFKLAAPANDSAVWRSGDSRGVYFGTAVHATLSGTGPHATFEYEA